jgi:hypothetical protein
LGGLDEPVKEWITYWWKRRKERKVGMFVLKVMTLILIVAAVYLSWDVPFKELLNKIRL